MALPEQAQCSRVKVHRQLRRALKGTMGRCVQGGQVVKLNAQEESG